MAHSTKPRCDLSASSRGGRYRVSLLEGLCSSQSKFQRAVIPSLGFWGQESCFSVLLFLWLIYNSFANWRTQDVWALYLSSSQSLMVALMMIHFWWKSWTAVSGEPVSVIWQLHLKPDKSRPFPTFFPLACHPLTSLTLPYMKAVTRHCWGTRAAFIRSAVL